MKLLASANDTPVCAAVKNFAGWALCGLGWLFSHATELAALGAFAWSVLNIFFLLKDRWTQRKGE